MTTGQRNESSFWEFSLAFYARPGVAPACLELQDNDGIDVNVFFFLLFVAARERAVTRDDVSRIDVLVKAWRESAVVPLRTLRRRLKSGIGPFSTTETDTLRSAVKRIELEAERIEQEWLERNVPIAAFGSLAASQLAAAQANVAAYGEFMGGLTGAPVAALLAAFAAHVAA